MKRFMAALLAAMIVSGTGVAWAEGVAAALPTAASNPFERVPLPHAPPRSRLGSTVCLLAGVGLIAGSLELARHADRAYDHYLFATSPASIEQSFDDAVHYDRWSSAALLTGEALIATGIYLRFLHRPSNPVSINLASRSCALSLRF